VGETRDGNLNAIRLSLSGLWSGGDNSALLGKCRKKAGQVLPLVKRAQMAARYVGGQPWVPRPPREAVGRTIVEALEALEAVEGGGGRLAALRSLGTLRAVWNA